MRVVREEGKPREDRPEDEEDSERFSSDPAAPERSFAQLPIIIGRNRAGR